MLRIVQRIDQCDDGLHRMRPGDVIQGITLHMFAVSDIDDAAGIAAFYRMNRQWTDGQMPYTYVIKPSGLIEQALHLHEVGPHALRWSTSTLGVAWVAADFNEQAPTESQWDAGVDLCADLCGALELDPVGVDAAGLPLLAGHTERPHATRSKGKNCPGNLFDLARFREETRLMKRESALQRLKRATTVA